MNTRLFFISILVRTILIIYGTQHDKYFEVKYTDIDYTVFTDASNSTFNGGTPYDAPTYKYTPLLALLLLPNIGVHVLFGKILFCFFDVMVALVMRRIMQHVSDLPTATLDHVVCCCWLFNPFTMTISSRGNAEAVQIFLVITALYLVLTNHLVPAGLFYGLSVHFKIYPIIYGVPFLLYLTSKHSLNVRRKNSFLSFVISVVTLPQNILFGSVSLATFFAVGYTMYLMYIMYGHDFIANTYLFHLSRVDIQHNFSPYFYLLKITQGSQLGIFINRLAFVPQFGTVLWIGARFHERLPVALFLQTFAFVALNKVSTSQYFIWYIGLLPVAYPYLSLSSRKIINYLFVWFFSQAFWLLFAYLYEFRNYDVLLIVWIASLGFLATNLYILEDLVRHVRSIEKITDKKVKKFE